MPTAVANRWVLEYVIAGSLLLARLSIASGVDKTTFGVNYDVVHTDTSLVDLCKMDPNATIHHRFALTRYDDPEMRKAVREDLSEMHLSGFRSIRTLVQLIPGTNSSGDLIDTSNVNDSVLSNLREYLRDFRNAGFHSIILAFGAQGTANPGCRKTEWGDCFDPKTLAATMAAESKIIAVARSVEGIALRVDLLNEACPSKSIPLLLSSNFAMFIRSAVTMHAARFPETPATVSCQIERTSDGLVRVENLFTESGDHVGFFDVHAYPGPAPQEKEFLKAAAAKLSNTDLPIIFGETDYADPEYRDLIVAAYKQAFHRNPDEILFWPVHSKSPACNFEVENPYRLKDALGGGSRK